MAGENHPFTTPLAGRTLKGKWRLENQIGTGGMASVWAARHRNGKRVAIKLLHSELTRDESVRRRFLREGYVANKVKHPAVVTILDDDDDGEMVFLVMELLEGETLSERWKRSDRRLGLRYVLGVADQVLDVLAVAHEQGIVHRDIKPANLFVTTADELKVLDFGIARLHEGPAGTGHTTRLGATLGSPSFMSPEQARARWEFVDARTDLWAVGAVMFALLSGKNVHEGKTAAEVLIATATQTARSLRVAWPEAPDVVAAIVDRALAFERDDRWQDARAMQTVVRRALQIDFDRPRTPLPSMVDASMVAAPPPSVGKATEVAFFGARDEREALTTAERPPPASTASPSSSPSARPSAFPSPSNHPATMTQATGLMPTLPFQIPQPPGPLSSAPPPSAPPASASPASAPPASEPTTSAPVAGPVEPAIPTIPPPLLQPAVAARSLRPTIVLGMFIAGGLAAGGATLGLMLRRPLPAAVVVAPAAVETSAPSPPALAAPAPAPTPAEAAVAPAAAPNEAPAPSAAVSASAPTDGDGVPDASADAAAAPAASASAGPKKKPPGKPRPRPPKGSGKFLQRR